MKSSFKASQPVRLSAASRQLLIQTQSKLGQKKQRNGNYSSYQSEDKAVDNDSLNINHDQLNFSASASVKAILK